MDKPSRRERVKKWVREHKDELVATTFFSTIAGVYIVLVAKSYKDAAKEVEEYNQWVDGMNTWLNDERKSGNGVYRLDDGRYLVVPFDAPQETVIK